MAETRGIDDIRSLIGKSKLAPRFNQRIFILDELHQCFPPDAEIQMWDYSYKKISDLIVGDRVLSFNHETNQVELSVVENTYELTNSKEIVTVEVEGGGQNCTADHKWWSVTRQCYVEAKDLIEGEEILIIESNKDT
jgi:DNA polymerase II large subunit